MANDREPKLIQRRALLKTTGLAGLGVTFAAAASRADACNVTTPRQTEGPFYPETGNDWEDEDLTRRRGAANAADGTVLTVRGVVRGGDACRPLTNCLVEIWQADDNGRYKHPGDTSGTPLDPNFQYWGRTYTDADGRYGFVTIRPGKYPGRTPHIHYKVVAPDGSTLVTQLYFTAEARNNARDGIYQDLVSRRVQDLVTVDWTEADDGSLSAAFDIALAGGDTERTPHVD